MLESHKCGEFNIYELFTNVLRFFVQTLQSTKFAVEPQRSATIQMKMQTAYVNDFTFIYY